jgi:hypothetical protein
MFDDDDDNEFEFDFNDDYDDEDAQKKSEKDRNRRKKLPIFKKAREILDIVDSLVELIDDNEESYISHYRHIMLEDAMIINAKLAGAEGGDLYTLRMENAVIIKIHARSLLTQTSGLKMFGFKETQYLQVLRDAIEEFRVLFIEWVNGFDKSNDIPDEWGQLFR